MLRCFYGNLSRGLRQAGDDAKFRFPHSSVGSVASFRWSRWPFQKTYANKLDALQRKMLAGVFEIKPRPEEPYLDCLKPMLNHYQLYALPLYALILKWA